MLAIRLLACLGLTAFTLVPAGKVQDEFKHGPDSKRQEGVPRGTVTEHSWKSEVFPGAWCARRIVRRRK